jgi:hypothetical protein
MNGASRIWLPAFIIVVFASGIVTGLLFSEYLQLGSVAREGASRRRLPLPIQLTEMLADELQMTREQRLRLDAIVNVRRRNFESVREEMRKRVESDASSLTTEIREILMPEQLEKFEDVVASVRARFVYPDDPERPREP